MALSLYYFESMHRESNHTAAARNTAGWLKIPRKDETGFS
jgi:hypothetical protein